MMSNLKLQKLNLQNEILKLVEQSGSMITFHRLDGELLFASSYAKNILGYTEQELCTNQVKQLFHPNEYRFFLKTVKEQYKETNGEQMHVIYRLLHKNGDYVWVESWITRTDDHHRPNEIGFLSITRDITDRKRKEQRIIEEEKLNVVGQLAAGIAHEIRNPLTTLKGFLQILERAQTPKKEYIHIMKEEIHRIEIITSEMLYLGKPANEAKEACRAVDLVRDVIALLLPEANLKDISLRFANLLGHRDPLIFCNSVQIKQVLINTIKNAMDASSKYDEVRIELSQEQEEIVIRIIDQGNGIHPDDLKKLGQPFFTTKETGTGLGLLISYNIVKEHNGSIHIDSVWHHGTTFTLKFPVYR